MNGEIGMLDVRRLALLRELEARGSIAAVSRALGISSSAISQQLTKLEVETGIPLTEQVGRSLQLTPAAQLLARRTDEAIAILEHAEAELEARRSRVQGVVRFAAFSTFAMRHLPEVLHRMATTHPDVVVEFTQVEPAESLEAVAGRRIDLAVTDKYPRIPRRVDATMTTTHLCRDDLAAYLPHAVSSLDDLGEVPWVFEPPGSDAHSWAVRMCREAGFEPVVRLHSPDLRLHYELCVSGVAAAFLPRMVLETPSLHLPLPAFSYAWPDADVVDLHRDVYAVTRRGARTRPAVAALLGHLKDVAEQPRTRTAPRSRRSSTSAR
ncbi:MAG: LysR family transcriptional regulator [Nocardioidaceae bacterium]|nr:LysR family transcriptional regulator [Nocardioidaceae bacterium]MCL2613659.1 LysR family transcriptional regulator [Nocardioidaceae bacterium]